MTYFIQIPRGYGKSQMMLKYIAKQLGYKIDFEKGEFIPMNNNDAMLQAAKELAAKAITDWFKTDRDERWSVHAACTAADMYVVWFSKTLQNWKALVSTDKYSGFYIEVTHNGDKKETYVDVYKKAFNKAYKDSEEYPLSR